MDRTSINPVVTVVIPVYNCEKYLQRAAMSVLEQPCSEDIELILVDDGSTDSSGSVCDRIAEKYQNIIVIHKANGGVSSARNTGIEAANGQYLAFCDADDWWNPNIFDEKLKALLLEEPTDLCAFGVSRVSPDGKWRQDMRRESKVYHEAAKPGQYPHVSYFYKTSFIKKYEIRYPLGKYGEDPVFATLCVYFSRSTRSVDKILYNYWMNPSSAMHSGNSFVMYEEVQKCLHEKRRAFSKLGVDLNNDREILSLTMEMLPQICVEHRYRFIVDKFRDNELLSQNEIQPWKHMQKDFRLWQNHPFAFYLKSQIRPGIVLRAKWLLQKTVPTRKLSDWVQYRLIGKWEKNESIMQ